MCTSWIDFLGRDYFWKSGVTSYCFLRVSVPTVLYIHGHVNFPRGRKTYTRMKV